MSTARPEYEFRRILTSDEARFWFLIGWWFGYVLAIVVIFIGVNLHYRDVLKTHRPGMPAELRAAPSTPPTLTLKSTSPSGPLPPTAETSPTDWNFPDQRPGTPIDPADLERLTRGR